MSDEKIIVQIFDNNTTVGDYINQRKGSQADCFDIVKKFPLISILFCTLYAAY